MVEVKICGTIDACRSGHDVIMVLNSSYNSSKQHEPRTQTSTSFTSCVRLDDEFYGFLYTASHMPSVTTSRARSVSSDLIITIGLIKRRKKMGTHLLFALTQVEQDYSDVIDPFFSYLESGGIQTSQSSWIKIKYPFSIFVSHDMILTETCSAYDVCSREVRTGKTKHARLQSRVQCLN
ncbi:hypothetical protein BCR42DRAFT_473135 [Absidia repens]|uniref:Uncharacterized protein n=1 Tax=Absidia repens TaxID=90262 RepID=A0A1X2IU38_9FUNG|nr:hypothetical protein BCR42DRAFT_473135 [Absidia repens]